MPSLSPGGCRSLSRKPLMLAHYAPNVRSTVLARRRGEHQEDGWLSGESVGSSPQARGTRWGLVNPAARLRFIPAGAGNTAPAWPRSCRPSVHPRRRGEHDVKESMHMPLYGSSPQARGTPEYPCPLAIRMRFIPAGAGNTSTPTTCPAVYTVHPRRRGEHDHIHPVQRVGPGSSPQARGTRAAATDAPMR